MLQLILIFHVLIAIALIVLVLMQQGKGAQMGAAFGSGASQTVFGSQGSGSFLVKVTAMLAGLFFLTSLGLGYFAGHQARQDPLQALTNAAASMPAKSAPKPAGPMVPNAGVPIPAGEMPAPTGGMPGK